MAAHIIGFGYTKPAIRSGAKVFDFIKQSLDLCFKSSSQSHGLNISHLDGIIALPSLAEPKFMTAHSIATLVNCFPHPRFIAKTIDVGGAGPVSGILEAKRLIQHHDFDCIAVVSADTVSSLPSEEFLKRADEGFIDSNDTNPHIPNSYDRIAEWHIKEGFVTREQLAMVTVLMSQQSSRHPDALTKVPYTLQQVLEARSIGKVTGLLECARRADGGAAVLVASSRFMKKHGLNKRKSPIILGGGETSSALYPPIDINEKLFTLDGAVRSAFIDANNTINTITTTNTIKNSKNKMTNNEITLADIQFYGLYDCFPICFIRAIEAVGIAPKHEGGRWIESVYNKSIAQLQNHESTENHHPHYCHNNNSNDRRSNTNNNKNKNGKNTTTTTTTTATTNQRINYHFLPSQDFPINTHGGLMCFGAPWETPAMYNIIEAVHQLNGTADESQIHHGYNRQIPLVKNALVYGNGGIFSSSSVAVLSNDYDIE